MVSRISIGRETKDLFLEILPAKTRRAFRELAKSPLLAGSRWYLAGGTALALQAGHRQSVDLDFFTSQKFDEKKTAEQLSVFGQWETTSMSPGTIYGEFLGAKISLIYYPFFKKMNPLRKIGFVNIISPADISVMKIIAISQRGKKRDFFDLYWHCHNRGPLETVIDRAIKQYPYQQHNIGHIYNSLSYFADAEDDPMPKIFFRANWKEIKQYFQKEMRRITRKFVGLEN